MRQIVVRADGVLGRHNAFAFDKPYRLVIDFEHTSLGKVPSKLKIEKPPIDEIRLGKMDNRARLVIDFGDYPVPSYAIERQENMAVIALGEHIAPRAHINHENAQENEPKPQKRQAANSRPAPVKKEPNQLTEQTPAPAPIRNTAAVPATKNSENDFQAHSAVKKAFLSNDLLLIELQDPRNPGQTLNLAIDIDLKDQTLRSASLSSLNGEVKRFEISEFNEPVQAHNDKLDYAPAPTVGPRKTGASNTVFENKPMEKPKNVFNVVPSVTSIQPPETQVTQNPLKMEEFKLQVKKNQ